MAAKLPCASRIHFLGPRTDARRLLGVMDIYVHPARGEGFGLAIAEAMLASKPVVVAREAAPVEYIHDGDNGLLFEPGNAADLAGKIMRLAGDIDLANRLAANGRAYCLTHFAPSRFAEAMCRLIELSVPRCPAAAAALQEA